jgi:hypothetical protein
MMEVTVASAKFALWACALAKVSCVEAMPTVATIQAAYTLELSNGSSLHDKGLRIIEASCDRPVGREYLCQVTFLSEGDPTQRLYFDVVAIARSDRGWELKSGLCKR